MMEVFDQQTLELTLKASNEGIWDWDIVGGEIFYSEQIMDFFGRGASKIPNIMLYPEGVVHEDSIDYFKDALSLTLLDSDAEYLKIDCKISRPDTEARWIRIRGIVIRNEGKAVRVTGSMIDISKRKFAEELVAEERNMLRLIIDNIPLQVYFKDTKSCYKLVNQRQVEWLGKQNISEVIGKSGEHFFSSQSWKSSRQEELHIMETGKPVVDSIQIEHWPHKPDTYVQKVKYPWYDSSGELLGTYGISCDVTSLIQAKKKLEDLAITLQQQNKSYQEELKLATEIQRSILPENTPDWDATIEQWKDRVRIQTLYSPASELAGDFYDIITVSEHKVGFLIIDVMGHGVRSAIIVSLIRGLMEQADHFVSEPTKYLEQINVGLTAILQKSSITLFASACYTLIDFNTGEVSITSAGHDSPLIEFHKNATSYRHTVQKGPALGIFEDAHYQETIYPIKDIKSLLLFTDGIYEASNDDGVELGLDSLHQEYTLSYTNHKSSAVHHLYGKATEWMGHAKFQDDVCLINLEFA